MSKQSNRYLSSWEGYWSSLGGSADEIFWDVEPARAAAQDIKHFQNFFDPELPLIGVGCGNGTQTRFLANHFQNVIGVDIAPAALEMAEAHNHAPNIQYRLLDGLDLEQAEALHEEIGDANIYLRAVLHQLDPDDRPIFVRSLERLLGEKGKLYLIELSSDAEAYLGSLMQNPDEAPKGLARVFAHHITPGLLSQTDMAALFPADRFKMLAKGKSVIETVHLLPTGEFAKVPAFYQVQQPIFSSEE